MAVSFSSHCLQGLSVLPVHLEVEIARGMPSFSIIGMAGTSVQEAKERVRSAIIAAGYKFPVTRKVVNLSPAELTKSGSHFDLAIALGFLVLSEQINPIPADVMVIGELGLEGGVRGVSGILPAVLFARDSGFRELVLPAANLAEASLVDGIGLVPVRSLREAIDYFAGKKINVDRNDYTFELRSHAFDFGDISGHNLAKRALMIAAAGGHHVLMSGPPGSGKSLLARCFPSILPPLSREELLEVLKIYSVAGHAINHMSHNRPFRHVHQSCSEIGLIGGGASLVPGEISLAHNGVLFLDELPEFDKHTLNSLRGPLEEEEIYLRRGKKISPFPCKFQLIAAMNPCPCGYYGDSVRACTCSPAEVVRYQGKLSGPMLDRIDIQIEVPRVPFDEISGGGDISSAMILEKVVAARGRQKVLNRDLKIENVQLKSSCEEILRNACDKYALSGRAIYRLVRVARTIADLENSDEILEAHLLEALQYRVG